MADNFCVFNEVIENCTDEELDWLSSTEQFLYEGELWPDWAKAMISEDPEDLLFPMVHVDRTRQCVRIFSDDNASPMSVVPWFRASCGGSAPPRPSPTRGPPARRSPAPECWGEGPSSSPPPRSAASTPGPGSRSNASIWPRRLELSGTADPCPASR